MRAADGAGFMNLVYLITGIIALALLVYLFIALLFPERLG
jgi:K+-transporting ATPase KdpF subunit